MPAIFPRWANAAARGSLLALAIVLVGVPLALMGWVRTSYATRKNAVVEQPIAFDHRVHAHDLHIDCQYCHSTVALAASAGLPPTAACVGCHSKVLMASTVFAPVRASLASGRPIPWRRVNALPDFVFFNHSIHIAKGVGCETCHGRVDQMARVAQVTPMSMGWCLSCHRDPAQNLRPRADVTTMGMLAAAQPANDSSGEALMRAHGVQRLTNCTTCHR